MPRLSKARKELLTTMMKETIFEAATAVMSEHGPSGITMDRVAKAANVARSSLYDYFQDRDDLFQFVVHRSVEPIYRAISELAQADLPAVEKLASFYRAIVTHIGKHQRFVGMLLRDEVGRGAMESVKIHSMSVLLGHLVAIFEQGMKEGHFRRGDPVQLARMFAACGMALDEMQLKAGALSQAEQVEHTVQTLMGLFLHGISTKVGEVKADE